MDVKDLIVSLEKCRLLCIIVSASVRASPSWLISLPKVTYANYMDFKSHKLMVVIGLAHNFLDGVQVLGNMVSKLMGVWIQQWHDGANGLLLCVSFF